MGEVEEPLTGGDTTPGVVRIGDTVRRPQAPNAAFAHRLLGFLERAGFEAVPRFLGVDEQGREVLSFLDGWAPPNLECSAWSIGQLEGVARLLRRLHDLTAGSELAGSDETVVHGDPSPVNVIWRDGAPVGLIDFDLAAPGRRIDDVAYAAWMFVLAGGGETGLAGPRTRGRRLRALCDAYGLERSDQLLDAVDRRQLETRAGVERQPGRRDPERTRVVLAWIDDEHRWLAAHRAELGPYLERPTGS